uniref:L-aminoadipate-semialdehyde dehydrogenase-phosphopantetheinyl transferase-like n=1 Tax=Styela clava TaxID=7725 RepID=UPI00193A39FE|nr:L-aminoadipate-semialdehyde dehydrogenase-phosphopantetheinyl transferase-like [Styela clava]
MKISSQMVRYYFNLKHWQPNQYQWLRGGECIQDEERKRINEFVFKEDSKAGLIGRLLLRYSISKSMNIPWEKIKLIRTDKGKPIVDLKNSEQNFNTKLAEIGFNISHNGDFVVAVTDMTPQVGVDVMNVTERHGDTSKFFDLMTRNFTEREWGCIKQQVDDDTKMKMFYRHWCLKESFVKAVGKGIGYSLQKLSFEVDSNSEIKPGQFHTKTKLDIDGIRTNDWFFEESMIDTNHCVAVATDIKSHYSDGQTNQPFIEVCFKDFEQCFQCLLPISEDFWLDFDKKLTKGR